MLDLTRVRSGPTCVRQLANSGANVIKIDAEESTPSGSEARPQLQHVHRDKRGVTLNLGRGLAVFKTIVRKADVVVPAPT